MVSTNRPIPMSLERARQLVTKDRERRAKTAARRREQLRAAKLMVARAEAGLEADGTAKRK